MLGFQLDGMPEHAPQALHDRQTEAKPARHLGALVEPMELVEHRRALGLGNAEAGVPDFDPRRFAAAPAPISTRPRGVYLIALETKFCSSRRSSRRSERTASARRDEPQFRPLARAIGANSISS